MQHAPKLGIGEKDLQGVGMGLSVMDYYRLIQRQCKLKLISKKFLLLGLSCIIPIIVQTYLTDGKALFMGSHFPYPGNIPGLKARQLTRVYANCGIDIVIFFGNAQRFPAALHITAGNKNQRNILSRQRS